MSKPDNESGHGHSHEHDIGCLDAIEGLYAWLDNQLDNPESIANIEEHIRHCSSCYSRAEVEKLLTDRMRKTTREDQQSRAPAALQDRLKKLMDRL